MTIRSRLAATISALILVGTLVVPAATAARTQRHIGATRQSTSTQNDKKHPPCAYSGRPAARTQSQRARCRASNGRVQAGGHVDEQQRGQARRHRRRPRSVHRVRTPGKDSSLRPELRASDSRRADYRSFSSAGPLVGAGRIPEQKAKRAWRNLVGYKFDVSCPFEKRSCAETGKSRDDARAKCIARNPVCWVSDAK